MRQAKTQPLLSEILGILETTCHPLHFEAQQKASIINQSNLSLASIKPRKRDHLPIREAAVNTMQTLCSLKNIAHGKYSIKTQKTIGLEKLLSDSEHFGPKSHFFNESIFYLISYGRHIDVLRFLIKYKQTIKALKYTILLQIPSETFIKTVIMPYLKCGRLSCIIQHMIDMDETLIAWKDYIIQICLLLEKNNLLNCLYQTQLLLKDAVRASMTCIRFYTEACVTYRDLQSNSFHLINAQKHLENELELCQWEEIQQTLKTTENLSLIMKLDAKSLNQHINTIYLQMDATKFLANCEENGANTANILSKVIIC